MNRKNTAASGKLIKAVYVLYVCGYMLCASQSGRLEYKTVEIGENGQRRRCLGRLCMRYLFVGLGRAKFKSEGGYTRREARSHFGYCFPHNET